MSGLKRDAGPGRPKGLKNKVTLEVRDLAASLIDRPKYLRNLKQRMDRGDLAPQLEAMVWQYRYGRPPEQPLVIEQTVTNKTEPKQADGYNQLQEILKGLTAAGILPPDLLSRFAVIKCNGAECGNGELPQLVPPSP